MLATDFIQVFEAYCPQELAMEGDPVGLHIGTLNKEIKRVLITLDVRPETVNEAIEEKIDLIIAKHPPIFRAPKRLDTDNPQNKMYADLLKNDIAVYAVHTNIDIIENGLNDWFCESLGIENTTYLEFTHHYEEKDYGIGRVGKLAKPTTIENFSQKLKEVFTLDGLRVVVNNPQQMIQTIAICGGSGEKFYPSAIKKGADLYITGDIYYHTAHDMLSNGLAAIDPGHHIEVLFIPKLTEMLKSWGKTNQWDIAFLESKANTNPFTYK